MPAGLSVSQLHKVTLIAIDHPGTPILLLPPDASVVGEVGVSMKEQGWVEEVQQAVEGLKAGMGQIPAVHHAKAWGVGQQDVEPPVPERFGASFRARIHISRSVYWWGPLLYRMEPPSPRMRTP